ncbi:Ger(x)C family spore germination C-terminal domain-containing protein [Paenibacillus puerhi]|uniref:Ger(x)C family spore germination C-terminal domain-containing protein n=1 Tax=Paenibacillus puerhi TaxID=2692622 RepID=UPI00135C7064|nr:Ger(x)C family spore germination C-terminal domain-containing protein [Paenibacillus puerhi]
MHSMQANRAWRPVSGLLLLVSLVCSGCSAAETKEPLFQRDGGGLTVAGIDEGAGGIRITAFKGASGGSTGGWQPLGAQAVESRSFVALSDAAALPWLSKQAPQLVVIGESWVTRHGFPAAWVTELRRLGLREGSRPAVAIASGTAEAFVRRPDAAIIGRYAIGKHASVRDSLREMRPDYEADQALPLLPAGMPAARDGKNYPVSIETLLFKKQGLVGRLTVEESRVLACLRGGADLQDPLLSEQPEGEQGPALREEGLLGVSCRTGVASNGSWRRPLLSIDLRVNGRSSVPGEMDKQAAALYEERLKLRAQALIGRLQQMGVDPLGWGEATRAQFPGYWSADRWRGSWSRADIQLNVNAHIAGGGAL